MTADLKANFLGQSANRVKNIFERVCASAPVFLFFWMNRTRINSRTWLAFSVIETHR